MVEINREELAWAAGFFDGDGCVLTSEGDCIRLYITQVEPQILHRFKNAVFGTGRIHGPYRYLRKRQAGGPGLIKYSYQCSGLQNVQAVMAAIYQWLSPIKQTQYVSALFDFLDSNNISALKVRTGR